MPKDDAIHGPSGRARLRGGPDQSARIPFEIAQAQRHGALQTVVERSRPLDAFSVLLELDCEGATAEGTIVVVPPLSGQFAVMLRDLVIGLLGRFRVLVIDWLNVRHVPAAVGAYGVADNIATVRRAILAAGPDCAVVAACQGGIAALSATALLAAEGDWAPRALVLIAAQVDPLANPTPVVRMIRTTPLAWIEGLAFRRLDASHAGHGRLVYPAAQQLAMLRLYRSRHLREHRELHGKTMLDDGCDPGGFPFLDLYEAVMDLDARHFSQNLETVFRRRDLMRGTARWHGLAVEPAAIANTALLTVEGERDDIAAPGQTRAAHALCTGIPAEARMALTVPRAGHFSLFHGALWRRHVLPEVAGFCARAMPG